MKYLYNRWNSKYDGVQYFVQRLEEMLFHYSDDIVRAPVHNTCTLIHEYNQVEKAVQSGQVKSYQLIPILEEIKASLMADKILRMRFGDEFIERIASNLLSQKSAIVQYLNHKISYHDYYNWCVNYLKNNIFQPNHKDEIEFAARTWISHTIYYGYSAENIYHYLHSTFGQNTDPEAAISNFLARFSLEENKFRVYFLFPKAMVEFKELFTRRLKFTFEDDGFFTHINNKKNELIGYLDVDALDSNIALDMAHHAVDIFTKFYRVLSNCKNELISRFAYVRDVNESHLVRLSTKTMGFRLIETEPSVNLKETVDYTILHCQNKSDQTYEQINRIIDLHNGSVLQPRLADSFIDLWSTLEIVSENSSGESKVEKVISSVVPILKKDYICSVLGNIQADLHDNLNSADYNNLMEKITQGDNEIKKIACLIFLPEYEALLEELFKKLSFFSVIRQKIYKLYSIRSNKHAIIDLSEIYAKRIEWHIYRLYRTRNAIVHSGKINKYIQPLGEHLHIYVDQVINEILIKLSSEPTIKTVQDVLIDAKLISKKVSDLMQGNAPITLQDIDLFLENYYYKTKAVQ